jgi:hypothetical protein
MTSYLIKVACTHGLASAIITIMLIGEVLAKSTSV